jgi:tRNA 2-selenouridine synthase SelU
MVNETLNEAIEKKAIIELGKGLSKYFEDVYNLKNIPSKYKIENTVFQEFEMRYNQLQEEYKSALTKLDLPHYVDDRSTYEKNKFGERIAELYPLLLEEEKVRVWDKIEELYNQIMED